MDRVEKELGKHSGVNCGAMTKQEVAAALCRIGVQAGLWAIPEYQAGTQRIDVVWATRTNAAGSLWKPIAAFEIEGHNVALKSVYKNAKSLTAAGKAGASILAMVLFQVGPDGRAWHLLGSNKTSVNRAKTILGQAPELDSRYSVEVVLDEQLCDVLKAWNKRAVLAVEEAASAIR